MKRILPIMAVLLLGAAGAWAQEKVDLSMSAGPVKEITLANKGLAFTVNEITVKKGDRIKLTFQVTMGTHDWVIDEFNAKTAIMGAGKQETIEFVADKTGTFEFYCSVPGHRQRGMFGKFIVVS